MQSIKAAKLAPTAAPTVQTIKKTVFAFKTRPVIAPTGVQKCTYVSAINETAQDSEEFNRVVVTVELAATDPKNQPFKLEKHYNIVSGGRGFSSFLDDYNSWTEKSLTEDDLYNDFNGEADNGKQLIVEVGHRKTGKDWEAYIVAFHPAGYTAAETAEVAPAAA